MYNVLSNVHRCCRLKVLRVWARSVSFRVPSHCTEPGRPCHRLQRCHAPPPARLSQSVSVSPTVQVRLPSRLDHLCGSADLISSCPGVLSAVLAGPLAAACWDSTSVIECTGLVVPCLRQWSVSYSERTSICAGVLGDTRSLNNVPSSYLGGNTSIIISIAA